MLSDPAANRANVINSRTSDGRLSAMFVLSRWLGVAGTVSLFLALLALLTQVGCEAPRRRPNIVLIIVDTLRADHTSAYGYERKTTPNLEHYFAEAELFENAYSTASYTSASVVSILSGLQPPRHGIRDFYQRLSPDVRILPEYLKKQGYQTAAVVSNTVLTEEALGLAGRFDHYDDFVDERELNRQIFQRRASRTTDAALRWLNLDRDPELPHFLLLHYIDPHAPYRPPADELRPRFDHEGEFPLDKPVPGYQRLQGVTDGLDYVDRYDEEVFYADREMGRFLAAYAKQGLLDDALLVFTSDHGETLLDHHPRFTHSRSIWNEALRVPLLVRWPGGEASRNASFVSLVDLTPSILEFISGEVPEDLQGIPFARRETGDLLLQESWVTTRQQKDSGRLRSAIRNEEKWTFRLDDGEIRALWHADLATDPGETRLKKWEEADPETPRLLVEMLRAEVAAADRFADRSESGFMIDSPKRAPPLEPHQREALEALGYVE